MREVVALLTLLAAGTMVTGCSGEEADPAARTESAPAPPTFNPCDGLVPEQVADTLGVPLTMDDGSADFVRCTFNPDVEGGPVLDANYSIFPDGLDAVFDSMNDLDPDDVREIEVPGADAARIVVDFDDRQLFISGFVQNGDLIQTLDLVAPEPYDEGKLTRGVRLILGEFSKHAQAEPP